MAQGNAAMVVNRLEPQIDEIAKHKSDMDKMRDYFNAMEKVEIRVPKDRGEQFVQVNGYGFSIAPGIPVKVPRQIADMLRDAGVI